MNALQRRVGAILILLLLANTASAWGPHGHEVVAEVAARELTPAARMEVERLLGDRAGNAMREASTWADDVRNEPTWRHTSAWHWVNFRRGDCSYSSRDNCRNGDCVVGALERYAAVLAQRKAKRADRVIALKFLIHFVGDVHQPLHAGFADDRGGNDAQIRFGREGGNLHGYWDSDLIRRSQLSVRAYADSLLDTARESDVVSFRWHPRAPGMWAEESCRIVQQPDFYPGRRVPEADYAGRYLGVANERLEAAGHRLAKLLNTLLAATP